MCGICGIVGALPREKASAAVRSMMAAMIHRGPDDEGILLAPPVALGMRRLSIIDLAGGHQPMANEDGTVSVILNGEIYNFQELRRVLEASGHIFRTRSDTEAVVHAYEEWGSDCVHHLRGMFALAVLDVSGRAGVSGSRLFLARDRFGIKPLYYARADGTFVFGSEVRALLASGLIAPRLSTSALESYLLFGSVVEPETLVEGIRSLPPGHCLTVSTARPEVLEPEPYWTPGENFASALPGEKRDGKSPAAVLREALDESVRLHLIADVPLGVFLSSGMDSTALAALASGRRSGVHTFTVSFEEKEFSEATLARRTAERLGTTHQELLLRDAEMLARMDEAVSALDQPSMDGINTYFVSWAARQAGLKVALSGLGGDEVFGGYSTFQSTRGAGRVASVARRVPDALRAATAPALAALARAGSKADAARKLASLWSDPEALPQPFFFTRALFTPAQVATLVPRRPEGGEWTSWLERAAREADHFDEFTAVSWLESRSYMVNTLLRDTDAMSMAHSLEVRVPLLDHPLFEFVARLPEPVKRGTRPKALLVEALRDLLPEEIISKPKQTFTFPWERWLRGTLRARVGAGIANLHPALGSALDAEAVVSVWQDFLDGRTSWSRPWSLYVLNEWVKRHFSGTRSI